MRTRFVLLTVLALLAPTILADPATGAGGDRWAWPLGRHALGETFTPPADDYGPGHRGVDIAGQVGDTVRAVAAGRVSFAGVVAGVHVVTVDHGDQKSTYQPVRPSVQVGDAVSRGEPIGHLLGTPSHCQAACLHLGRRVADDYLDPLLLLGQGRFVLISPDGPPPAPPTGLAGNGELRIPVAGPVTSAFGQRTHPVTGVRKLHDGTDFGVPCGTAVHASADAVVIALGRGGPYGRRVVLRHRPGLETSYNHLGSVTTAVGDRVTAGQVIATSGNSGLSTGCHLHFMVVVNGSPVDPMSML